MEGEVAGPQRTNPSLYDNFEGTRQKIADRDRVSLGIVKKPFQKRKRTWGSCRFQLKRRLAAHDFSSESTI
jgi:hypothetical protein